MSSAPELPLLPPLTTTPTVGEMTRIEGSVLVRGEIAYFSQSSFILSATIKENIVFGHRFESE